MKFILIHRNKFNLKHLQEHPIWAEYYEPEDIKTIEEWGIEKKFLIQEFEKIGYSDEYLFPVLDSEDTDCFKFTYEFFINHLFCEFSLGRM